MRPTVLSGISALAGVGAAVTVNALLDRPPTAHDLDDPMTPTKPLNSVARLTIACAVGIGVTRLAASQIAAARREGEISDVPPGLRD